MHKQNKPTSSYKFDSTQFEKFVAKLMEEYGAPGVVVGVTVGGEVVYCRGFGYRDLENKLPATPDTVFGIASVTKSFTALSLLQLAESGKLSLHHPVKRYLPEFDLPDPAMADRVTIHHFLTHTAGIPPLPSLEYAIAESTPASEPDLTTDSSSSRHCKARDKDGAAETLEEEHGEKVKKSAIREGPERPSVSTPEKLMRFIATHDYQLLGAPGEYVSYSNDAFGLLGSIIERVSGKDYETYLQEHVLSPLGMSSTTTSVEALAGFPEVTKLYYRDQHDKIRCTERWSQAPAFTACGFLKSNVVDLLKYLNMYIGGGKVVEHGGDRRSHRVISEASISRMITPYYPYPRDVWYGYGFNVRLGYGPGVTLVQHSGSLRGVASNVGFVPEKQIGVAVLSNLTGFPSSKVWLGAVNLLLGLPVDHPLVVAKEYHETPERLRKLCGRYRSGEGADIKVDLKGGELTAQIESKEYPVKLTGPGAACITVRGVDNHARFLFNPDGEVWAVQYGSRVILKVE